MFSRVEEECLDYIQSSRMRQMDEAMRWREAAFVIDPDAQAEELSSAVTLPSSFIGSHAWASEQLADALTLCREHGKPSFFITITTNPNWPEITSQLQPSQTASDVPVVVARVFHLRLQKALEYIKRMMGSMVYLVKVIEFQSRGLPHAHMVFKVRNVYSYIYIYCVISSQLLLSVFRPLLFEQLIFFFSFVDSS